ncbi:MAG TPA: hypothetical protein VKY22_15120 [Bradyrhizobium sp.]|nr:hypothetical protein [Bradyrhizobium sp.]
MRRKKELRTCHSIAEDAFKLRRHLPLNLSYQFIHVEPFSREGAHLKGSTKRKCSMFDIRDEMIRAPHACDHVTDPQPPNLIFGLQPGAAFDLAARRAAKAVDKVGRRLRPEAHVVLVGVATWPELTAEVQQDAESHDWYVRWRDATVAWLQSQWGDLLVTVVEHLDELRPHIHYIVIPELEPDNRLRIASIHAGYRASSNCKNGGGTPREQSEAYKEAMKAFQDCYYEQVAVRCGLTRIGPRLQRLTRDEWKERKRQAEILAREHARLDDRLATIKRQAREFVAEKIAAANATAQSKIDSIATRSHHDITGLKQEANRRMAILRDKKTALASQLEEKDAVITAQEEQIAQMRELLAQHGIGDGWTR